MIPDTPRPFYHRLSHSLLSLAIITAAIYFGQDILVPLALSGLLAVLLRPVENWFIRRGMHKVMAILMAVALAITVVAGITFMLSVQLSEFTDDLPRLKQSFNDVYRNVRRWIRREYNLTYSQQEQYLKKAQAQTLESLQGAETLGMITGPLGTLLLMPFYVFLLLYYRTMLLNFLIALFAKQHFKRVREVLGQVKSIIQSYMVGLLIETASVAALNSIGLLLLGVEYAILMSVVAAILNLIPYIGGIVATFMAVAVTLINHQDVGTLLGVLGVFIVVQIIDNNLLVPLIVASKVRINALVSIIGVLVGGALAGVAGMFLSIPAIAIMKAIFDRVEGLEPWGLLLGDETPEENRPGLFRLNRRRIRIKEEGSNSE
ncbi:AI-2E family transporter [Nibrella saemangeumensis]|uniref:AI-2E family transporter n=1 Tax=Nibrella saemangeumensis TaxID=1084526 RepID=A0ABP8MAE5_9BACT